jgi:hypothetical protein
MSDVLKVAIERQRELRDEIDKLDEFIRMAENLLRSAKARPDEQAERPQPAPVREPAAEGPQLVRSEAPAEQEAAESEGPEMPRKFPWTGQQPAVRRTDGDDATGPTRKNVFRRDMTAAG